MRLWTFIFPMPQTPYCSARVAADSAADARMLLERVDPAVDAHADRVIVQYGGDVRAAAGVLRTDKRAAI